MCACNCGRKLRHVYTAPKEKTKEQIEKEIKEKLEKKDEKTDK